MKKEIEVTSFIGQKVKLFNNGLIEIKEYAVPIRKIKDGYEPIDNDVSIDYKSSVPKTKEENTVRIDSLYRSKRILMDYAFENENEFCSFITLTFKENLSDISNANKKFKTFISSVRRDFSDFKYLGVPEFQKRGAVHYHLLTNLKTGSSLCPLQKGCHDKYDVKHWIYGFSSVFDLTKTDEKFNVALYISKYLTKDFDNRFFGHTKVLKSNNLKKPLEIELDINDLNFKLAKSFINENDLSCVEKEIFPQKKYAIPFILTTCKTTFENVDKLKELFGFDKERKEENV